MAGDSAFRRLLLDTVSATISQTPSTNSLIDLLRITTPSLTTSHSKQRREVHAKVRDASQREKLYRKLQLRIHPDKHPGDERANILFQEVTLFYRQCIEAMEFEDYTRLNQTGHCKNINGTKSRATATTAHGDYENAQYDNENAYNLHKTIPSTTRERRDSMEPPSHQAFAVISLIFPPLGALALYHSLRVRSSWNVGEFADARHHSDQAYSYAWWSCFCTMCILLYIWLRDGDLDFELDWDKMKRNFPWDNGP